MLLSDVNEIDAKVRRYLRDAFGQEKSIPLTTLCEQVEDSLIRLTLQAILEELRGVATKNKVRFLDSESDYFYYGEDVYQVRITEHPAKQRVLQISIVNINSDKSHLSKGHSNQQFESRGKYNEVHAFTESVFQPSRDSVTEITRTILTSGYRWLVEYVRSTLDVIQNEAAEDLYSHLREVLPENLCENVWLYVIVERQGIYIPSAIHRGIALDRATKSSLATARSPIQQVAEFSTKLLEAEKLISIAAITYDQIMGAEFAKTLYVGSGLEIAEESIYQSKSFLTQPLVREGKALLVAGYPTNLRSQIEPLLRRERSKLKDIIDRRAFSLRSTVEQARDVGLLSKAQEYIKLAALFSAEYTKRLFEPG